MYFDFKQLSTTPAMVTRIGFADGIGNIYLGMYVGWSEPDSALYKSIDNGMTWTQLTATATWMADSNPITAATSDGTKLYVYRNDRTLAWSADAGATWTTVTQYVSTFTVGGAAVAGSPPDTASSMCWDGTYLYLSGGAYVWRSNDSGATWQAVLEWTRNDFSMIVASATVVIVGGKTMTGMRSHDHGATWEIAPGIDSATDWRAGGFRNGYFFIGVGNGYVYETHDAGTTVTRCSASGLNCQVVVAPPTSNGLYFGWYGNSSFYTACAIAPVFTPGAGAIVSGTSVSATSPSLSSHVALTTDGTAPVLPADITTLPETASATVAAPVTLRAVAAVVPNAIVDLLPSITVTAAYTLALPRQLSAGKAGAWHNVSAVFVGSGGIWKPADLHIGKSGTWK